MTLEQRDYLQREMKAQAKWHCDQARLLARAGGADEDERRDNRVRSEAASWRAEAWVEAASALNNAVTGSGAKP